ncbi:4'-phosphopantetheinyl transferase superfamily protein [Streptomyces sp. NPDC020096]
MPAPALGRRYFPTAEAEWIEGMPALHQAAAFLWLWSAKEAIGKARGVGLRHGGARQRIPLPAVWPPAATSPRLTQVPGSPGMWLSEPVLWAGCVVALAAMGHVPRAVRWLTDSSSCLFPDAFGAAAADGGRALAAQQATTSPTLSHTASESHLPMGGRVVGRLRMAKLSEPPVAHAMPPHPEPVDLANHQSAPRLKGREAS